MYLDAYLRVSNAQALTATAVSTDKIDLGASTVRRQIGTGEPMGFGLAVGVAADFTTGDETYAFEVVSDEDAALGSPTVHARYTRTAAQLALGSLHFFPCPQDDLQLYERYLGLNYVLAGTTPTVTVTAWLTAHALFSIAARAYSKNYAV
jgi:hypothetical protein